MAKSKELLDDFNRYCQEHPGERFWQALRNWSDSSTLILKYVDDNGILSREVDTFYLETRAAKTTGEGE